MNPYVLDYSKHFDDIKSVLKTIFGYEYSALIDERFNNILLTTYSNHEGIKEYYDFLEDAKSRELCIKFLDIIGVDTSVFKNISFVDEFDEDLLKIVNLYLDGDYAFKSTFQTFPDTFRAFLTDKSEMCSENTILDNRIKFINSIRNSKDITRDNYLEFTKTIEYKKILVLINKYNDIYLNLCDEMNNYMKSINEYKEHYYRELNRYEIIIDEKKEELYNILSKYFDINILNCLKQNIAESSLDNKLLIEYFSSEDEEKLDNKNVSESEKNIIIGYRKKYLSNLGIDINKDYFKLIEEDNIKNYIPSFELVNLISNERKTKKEEAIKKFIYESDSFKKATLNFADSYESKEYLYRMLKNKKICVHAGIFNNKLIPLMFLTIRHGECGTLDYIVLHETIHAIESIQVSNDDYSCGFEPQVFYGEKSPHIYIQSKRKYERLNETITDIFALEAIEILHALNIYLLDDKTRTKKNVGNNNTSIILKNILAPFIERYRNLIIEARLTGNMSKLYEYIGKNNFEELNDIIDYIDMLVEVGLERKLNEKNMNDRLVLEYINELKKLSNVYTDMDEHYKKIVSANNKELKLK